LRRRKDRLTSGEVSAERSASRRRSSATEHSFHGINACRQMTKSVTHVSGTSVTYLSGHSKEDIFQKGRDAARAGSIPSAGDTVFLVATVARSVDLCETLCRGPHMATNLSIDPELIEQALKVSGERTKKAAVTMALREFIARRRQKRLLDLMGKLEWDSSYDYKKERNRD
jgi:Arc/MetJ family transcription regulator